MKILVAYSFSADSTFSDLHQNEDGRGRKEREEDINFFQYNYFTKNCLILIYARIRALSTVESEADTK